ncbi:MAG: sigma-70 family RNA polymerase sigma factor [Acidobacteria bacterium]|nr:sigma-70 family RNA polymerase sigma factor [Acidobacteriota bacterium]
MNADISKLVEQYSDMVFRLVYRIVPDREEALDITQDIFVKLFEKPAYLNNAGNSRGYILKTAFNHALNYKRNQKVHRIKEQDYCSIVKCGAQSPEDMLRKTEQDQTVKRYLKELSPQQREAVLCRFYGEMKLEEIAGELEINEATVRIHIKRALNKLKNLMSAGQEG